MFAGLPGIGVGTLFYVLIALVMPVFELARVVRGTSSLARWKRILTQWIYAVSIVLSIIVAERLLLWLLGQAGPDSLNPARLLNHELMTHAPQSVFAAPIMASLLIIGSILVTVETIHVVKIVRRRRLAQAETDESPSTDSVFSSEALNSPPGN